MKWLRVGLLLCASCWGGLSYGALPALLDLANLSAEDRQRVLLIYGGNAAFTQVGDQIGADLVFGEMNGDAYDDLAIHSFTGRTYVIFGSPSLRGQTLNLQSAEFETPTPGQLRITLGFSAMAMGDVNGDGFDDLILGKENETPGGRGFAGRVYVVYGSASLPGQYIDLSASTDAAPLANETRILGDAEAGGLGHKVFAGDLNDDGFADIVAQAFNPATSDLPPRSGGGVILLAGKADLAGTTIDLSPSTSTNMVAGETRFLARDKQFSDELGVSAGFVDMDRDGINDFFLGAPQGGETGELYGFLCKENGVEGLIDLAEPGWVPDSVLGNGFSRNSFGGGFGVNQLSFLGIENVQTYKYSDFTRRIVGPLVDPLTQAAIDAINRHFQSGSSPAPSAIDPNNPPLHVAVAYPLADGLGRTSPGIIFLIDATQATPGTKTTFTNTPREGETIIYGAQANDQIGRAMDFSDLTGDGLGDLVIGAANASPAGRAASAGQVHVIYEGTDLYGATIDLNPTAQGQDVLVTGIGTFAQDNFGTGVAGGGDMDGDGTADFAAGAPGGDSPLTPGGDLNEGYVAVVFGEASTNQTRTIVYSTPGSTPRQALGGRLAPTSKVWVQHAAGAGPGGGASYTAALTRRNSTILNGGNLPAPYNRARLFWAVVTDRESAGLATLTFQYSDAEIAGLNETELVLFYAQANGSPWSVVPGATFDLGRNQVIASAVPNGLFLVALNQAGTAHWEMFE